MSERFEIREGPENSHRFQMVAESGNRAKRAIRQTFYFMGKECREMSRDFLKKGPRAGRMYKYKGRKYRASAAGQFPQRVSGALRNSVNFTVHGAQYLEFGAKAPYAGYLEEGTSKMAKRPFLDVTIKMKRFALERIGRREFEREFGKG